MARTSEQLTPAETLIVSELTGVANNTVIYKDNTWIINAVALWAINTVLTSQWATSTPTFSAVWGGTPTIITVANEATDTTCFPAFFTATTGDLWPKTNAGLTFNSNTAILAATWFSWPLTGNVNGTVGAITPTTATFTTLTAGVAASTTGSLALKGTTSGTVTLSVADAAGTWTMKLPTSAGSSTNVLTTDGSGNCSWAAASSGFSWGTSVSSGSGTGLAMTTADLAGDKPFITMAHTASGTLTTNTTTQFSRISSRTATGGTASDNYIDALFSRTAITNGANLTSAGSVVNITGTDTQTANTLTSTYHLLKLDPSLRSTGSSIFVNVANSIVNAPTNSHIYVLYGNTNSTAQVALKIDTGTSATAHTGIIIKNYNASSTAIALQIDAGTSTGNTWVGIDFSTSGGSWRSFIRFPTLSNSGTGQTMKAIEFSGDMSWHTSAIWYWLYFNYISNSNSGTGYGIYMGQISAFGTSVWYGWYVGNIWSTNAGNTAKYFSLNNAQSSATLANRTLDASDILFSRTGTHTTGTITDAFNLVNLSRTQVQNGAGGTFATSGSVLKLTNVVTQTAGTSTDTTDVLLLSQSATASATGNLIKGQNNTTTVFLVDKTGILTLGAASTGTGAVKFTGTTSWVLTLTSAAAAGTWTMTLPTTGGTSGYFLQTDGSGTTTWAAWSAPKPKVSIQLPFEAITRLSTAVTGDGTATVTTLGLRLSSPTTTASSATATALIGKLMETGSPTMTFTLKMYDTNIANGSGDYYVWLWAITTASASLTYTDAHAWFKIIKSGGVISIYATQADGVTETASSALTTIGDAKYVQLCMVFNSTTSIDYYYAVDGAAMSSATNLSANLPATLDSISASISNRSSSQRYLISLLSASYVK